MTLNATARSAVIFKAYAWDAFVERQARRLQEAAGGLDFFVQIDESNGPVGPVPFDRVVRFTTADLQAMGLPMRFGLGGVLWWNPDYAHYQFQERYSDYDYYVFVEYDCVVQCSIPELVTRAAARGADLVALPIGQAFATWHWNAYQGDAYAWNDVRLALLNVTVHSVAGLTHLRGRRQAMASASIGGWPSSEVFVPTETALAGMHSVSLAELGDVSRCDWFPPMLEDDLAAIPAGGILHPVLDRRRYIASVLHNAGSLPAGGIRRALLNVPREEYRALLWPAARGRAVRHFRHKWLRLGQKWLRLRQRLMRHGGSTAEAASRPGPRTAPSRKPIPGRA